MTDVSAKTIDHDPIEAGTGSPITQNSPAKLFAASSQNTSAKMFQESNKTDNLNSI